MKKCKKCGNAIIGRLSNARYCTISCQEHRRNEKYQAPTPRANRKQTYNPAYPHLDYW